MSDASLTEDLGFTYVAEEAGSVELFHRGRLTVVLRGRLAQDFMAEAKACDYLDRQQLMARLTGNYKRGNERTARDHTRNRR